MEFIRSSPEEYRSWSEESDGDTTGIGRSYECVFCKRGFTTAQALGGHMNIHRKDRANKSKHTSSVVAPNSSSTKLVDLGFYSHDEHSPGNYYYLTPTTPEVDSNNNYPQLYHNPSTIRSSSHHVQFGGDWRRTRSLSLYTNPFCLPDKIQNDLSEDGLDLELRLGYQP